MITQAVPSRGTLGLVYLILDVSLSVVVHIIIPWAKQAQGQNGRCFSSDMSLVRSMFACKVVNSKFSYSFLLKSLQSYEIRSRVLHAY